MASVNDDPPSGQGKVITTSGNNAAAGYGPYIDRGQTVRNASNVAPALNIPGPSGSTTTGSTRPVYANDQLKEVDNDDAAVDNVGVTPPPHAPNKMAGEKDSNNIFRSRDPYRNNGMTGQSFFANSND